MKNVRNSVLTFTLATTLAFSGVHTVANAESVKNAAQMPVQAEAQTAEKKTERVDLYLGDKAICQLENRGSYEELIKKLQNHFKTQGAHILSMTIEPSLSVKKTDKTEEGFLTTDDAFKLLTEGGKREAVYIAEKTESLESIAKRYGMTLDEIKSLNPNWEDPVTKGSKLKVLEKAPLIEMSLEEVVVNVEDVPFQTVTKEDDTMIKTQRQVERAGVPGQRETSVRIQSQNGKIISSIVEGSRMSREAVDKIVRVGTKQSLATGKFINPTVGRFTSPFGPRWGRFHYGIDIANSVGTDIKAADGGIVTRAGSAGSYGNLIIIDHQNGTSTRYAHLSRIDVKVGQAVEQGQSIAKMGNTGRSTGSHLHFEVRVGGVAQNPLNYVKY
ncbi:peptidase, M23 family [Aedoeadaptatus coxii]|uniref:peptidoglycan DD-metalloendopeptidase family protein n=1 Tax=Aedoeadaptatus coxii TaxID=755172 RepID=UPI00177042A3|nr:M23 family metallopeptidase [Peptoniphilus coxii]CAC9933008.1 peptidase, M23 family [Peptoniphilus coxii]